ncbi:MAG: hypothetical protein ACOVRM_15390 [Planctomycetaceae bacterium]|jgi:hypothetical protein
MSTDNPFEVIGGHGAEVDVPQTPGWFTVVDGNRIACGRLVQLPPICIKTGATENLSPFSSVVQVPAFRFVLTNYQVHCHYYLSQSIARRLTYTRRIGRLITLSGLLMLLVMPFILNGATAGIMAGLGVPVAVLGSFVATFAEPGLRIHSTGPANTFVLRGFAAAFFRVLAELKAGNSR